MSHSILVMYAFFDDSSSPNSKGFMCFSGFVADDTHWNTFTNEWIALLDKHGIRNIGLHTKDFMAAEKGYKPFKGIGQQGRINILKEFISIVRKNVLFGVSIGLDSVPFKDVAKAFKQYERDVDNPYMFCFVRVLKRLMMAAERRGITDHVALMVDDNGEHAMRYYQLLRKLSHTRSDLRQRICWIAFCDDRVTLPIQAADMLAWITSNEMRKVNPDWESSPFMEILLAPDPAFGIQYEQEYWNEEECRSRLSNEYASRLTQMKSSSQR